MREPLRFGAMYRKLSGMSLIARSCVAIGVGALVASLGVPSNADGMSTTQSLGTRLAPAVKATPGWHKLSVGSFSSSLDQPSVMRFGDDVQVVWIQDDGSSHQDLYTTLLDHNGKPTLKSPAQILRWDSLLQDPAVRKYGNKRVIVFSGIRNGSNSSDPYDSGALYYLTSSDGTNWKLSHGSLSQSNGAYGSYGLGATTFNGQPLVTFTDLSSNVVRYHLGFDASNPASTPDQQATPLSGNAYLYAVDAGTDATTGKAYALWYGAAAGPKQMGVDAEQIEPSLGTILNGPQANTTVNGTVEANAPDQDVPAASLPKSVGGGLYTAYTTYSGKKIIVWRVGSKRPAVTIPTHDPYAQIVGITPSIHGRLWVYWRADSNQIRAVRTNGAVSRIGVEKVIHTPGGATPYRLSGDGSQGPLNLVALLESTNGASSMQSIHILPGLHAAVSPKKVKRGKSFTVTLTDAGAGVRGVKATFQGMTKTTNRRGKVTFKVTKSTPLGLHPVRYSDAGYSSGKISVKVVK